MISKECRFPENLLTLGQNGAAGEIRTPDTLVRSQVLYPAELRPHLIGYSYYLKRDLKSPFEGGT